MPVSQKKPLSKSDMRARAFDRWENEGGSPPVIKRNEPQKPVNKSVKKASSSKTSKKK